MTTQAHPDKHYTWNPQTREYDRVAAEQVSAYPADKIITYYWFESIQQYCTIPSRED